MQHPSWFRKELNTDVTFDVNQVRLEASSVFFTDNLIRYLSESKGFLCSVIKQTEFPSSKYLVVTPPPPTPPHSPSRPCKVFINVPQRPQVLRHFPFQGICSQFPAFFASLQRISSCKS